MKGICVKFNKNGAQVKIEFIAEHFFDTVLTLVIADGWQKTVLGSCRDSQAHLETTLESALLFTSL